MGTVDMGFNSRAPRGARQAMERFQAAIFSSFNSRAPRGARRILHYHSPEYYRFNSRAPRGARQPDCWRFPMINTVSIHVPLAEHDCRSLTPTRPSGSFNSRAPRGARRLPYRPRT